MAIAMRAWGERNPNAIRVISRILVFIDSIKAFDRTVNCTAWRGSG